MEAGSDARRGPMADLSLSSLAAPCQPERSEGCQRSRTPRPLEASIVAESVATVSGRSPARRIKILRSTGDDDELGIADETRAGEERIVAAMVAAHLENVAGVELTDW